MPCYHPLQAWRSKVGRSENGAWPITFQRSEAYVDMPLVVPCSQCIGCRLERSRQWAVRCVHEAMLYEDNLFVTLTYRDECLPKDNSLELRDMQLFMKRLRKLKGEGVRVFYCGEYGDQFQRPHFHAVLFNCAFSDMKPWSSRNGQIYYTSEELSELWDKGFSTIGHVTFESAAYVARYVTKKVTGDKADDHYFVRVDERTGEIIERTPEFAKPSRRPGLGRPWFELYYKDVYPSDQVIIYRDEKPIIMRPPKYYDDLIKEIDPSMFKELQYKRKHQALSSPDNTWERLLVREEIQHRKFDLLHRSYENEG